MTMLPIGTIKVRLSNMYNPALQSWQFIELSLSCNLSGGGDGEGGGVSGGRGSNGTSGADGGANGSQEPSSLIAKRLKLVLFGFVQPLMFLLTASKNM